jgi:hypothetical protein
LGSTLSKITWLPSRMIPCSSTLARLNVSLAIWPSVFASMSAIWCAPSATRLAASAQRVA